MNDKTPLTKAELAAIAVKRIDEAIEHLKEIADSYVPSQTNISASPINADVELSVSYNNNALYKVRFPERDVVEWIWDNAESLPESTLYLDPPYISATRQTKQVYSHEMTDGHHRDLVDLIVNSKANIVLSGYEHPIYETLLAAGWNIARRKTYATANRKIRTSRVECIYTNCNHRLTNQQTTLYHA